MTAEDAAAAFDRGAAERAAGNTDAAREAFRVAAESGHPDLGPKALANLAVLEAQAGRVAEARAAFEQAIASGHPDHAPQSLFNYAIFQDRNGEPAHAYELYRQAVATGHPEHARKAMFNLANLAAQLGRLGEATELFLRAMEPPFVGDTAQRAHRRLIEVDPSRLPDARALYRRAIESGDGPTAAHARALLHDLPPDPDDLDPTISLGTRTFRLADIEDAEWALGRPPTYSSGHLDVYTHDGGHHVVFVDLRDPYDRRGVEVLRHHLGARADWGVGEGAG